MSQPSEMRRYVKGLTEERLVEAEQVASTYRFRLPEFYASKVLDGSDEDPLLDLVFPTKVELDDGDELWDGTPSEFRASHSPFWIQKYPYQGLIRVTSYCSGLCRFCYVKNKNVHAAVMRERDVDRLFDDLEVRGRGLREIILSGGDPLAAPLSSLRAIAKRMAGLRSRFGEEAPHISIHTREPVWDPPRVARNTMLLRVIGEIAPSVYMFHITHPREVTSELAQACSALADANSIGDRPALLVQHAIFRGVNDSVEVLEELYRRLLAFSPPILPYYLVYPFYNGTLPKHRLDLLEAQSVYRELAKRPGVLLPKLVVPTPTGKCIVGPHESIPVVAGMYRLRTKNGEEVSVPPVRR